MASTLQHPILGGITLVRSLQARRLTLSVRPSGEVRLTFPWTMPKREALAFLEEKLTWVQRSQLRVKRRETPTITVPFNTRRHSLKLVPCNCDLPTAQLQGDVIAVNYPEELGVEHTAVQETIVRGIEEAWRTEAKAYLPQRVAELAAQHGMNYGRVSVRNSRTRWGSCSSGNNLSLSLHLMKLPDALIDYIVLHELCHTRIKNHGPQFHALLDQMTEGAHRTLARALKEYSTRCVYPVPSDTHNSSDA